MDKKQPFKHPRDHEIFPPKDDNPWAPAVPTALYLLGANGAVPLAEYVVRVSGTTIEYWSRKPPEVVVLAFSAALKSVGEFPPGSIFILTLVHGVGDADELEAAFRRVLKTQSRRRSINNFMMDLTQAPELRKPRQMREKDKRGREPKNRKPTDTSQTPDDSGLADASFRDEEVVRLQGRIDELERRLTSALLPVKEQLKQFAQIRTAAELCDVSHGTIHNAIASGKLLKYELAGHSPVVNLLDCKSLWPKGAPMGRPLKK